MEMNLASRSSTGRARSWRFFISLHATSSRSNAISRRERSGIRDWTDGAALKPDFRRISRSRWCSRNLRTTCSSALSRVRTARSMPSRISWRKHFLRRVWPPPTLTTLVSRMWSRQISYVRLEGDLICQIRVETEGEATMKRPTLGIQVRVEGICHLEERIVVGERQAQEQLDHVLYRRARLGLEQVGTGEHPRWREHPDEQLDEAYDIGMLHVPFEHPPELANLQAIPEKDVRLHGACARAAPCWPVRDLLQPSGDQPDEFHQPGAFGVGIQVVNPVHGEDLLVANRRVAGVPPPQEVHLSRHPVRRRCPKRGRNGPSGRY